MFSKEVKVGLLTIVAGILLYFGFNFLKGIDFFSSTSTYYIKYNRVDGLQVSNIISVRGHSVGRVSRISIRQEKSYDILVEVEIDEDIEIKSSAEAILKDAGVLGGKMIELENLTQGRVLSPGDTIKSKIDHGLLGLVEEKATPIIHSLEGVADSIKLLVSAYRGMSTSIKSTMKNLNQSTGTLNSLLASEKNTLKKTIQNVEAITSNLALLQKEINPMVSNFKNFSDSLQQLPIAEVSVSLKNTADNLNAITESIKKQEGTLGKAIGDDKLYKNLNQSLKSLDSLLTDLREHPKRYVHFSLFGRKEKK